MTYPIDATPPEQARLDLHERYKRWLASHAAAPAPPEAESIAGIPAPASPPKQDPHEAWWEGRLKNLGLTNAEIGEMCERTKIERMMFVPADGSTSIPLEHRTPSKTVTEAYLSVQPERCRRWHLLTFFQIIGWLLALSAVALGVCGVVT